MRSFIERLIKPGRSATLLRRSITIPAYLLVTAVAWLGLPLWLLLLVIADLVRDVSKPPRRPRFILTRLFVFGLGFLTCEVIGIGITLVFWLASLVLRPSIDRYRYWNFCLQQAWGATLLGIGKTAFHFRTVVSGQNTVTPGPIILLLRHSSLADTVLALAEISKPHRIILRYVLKRPLLLDPCIDIAGQRLLNHFVIKGQRPIHQMQAVARLAQNLGPNDGVLIYPEGTRFSEAKRTKHLARLERRKQREELDFARSLEHILPPIRGGVSALLSTNDELEQPADIVFCAHAGFEHSATVKDLLSGRLLGQTIRIHFWRVPFAEVPEDADQRERWLKQQWRLMDHKVGELKQELRLAN